MLIITSIILNNIVHEKDDVVTAHIYISFENNLKFNNSINGINIYLLY